MNRTYGTLLLLRRILKLVMIKNMMFSANQFIVENRHRCVIFQIVVYDKCKSMQDGSDDHPCTHT